MRQLITQIYFANESLNEIDKLYLEAPAEQRPSIIIDVIERDATFNIVHIVHIVHIVLRVSSTLGMLLCRRVDKNKGVKRVIQHELLAWV
jgi:hypothetical protein